MKHDIESRDDLELAIRSFYSKATSDKKIGVFFTEVIKINWEKHIPIMVDFWENAIFHTGNYSGDTMNIHKHINTIYPLEVSHFNQWTLLFLKTIDELFQGPNAETAKQRALSISTIMQIKILRQ